MATILKTKNSVTTTVVPSSLAQGELAVNIADKKLWVGNASSTPVLISDYSGSIIGGSNTQVQYNSSGAFAGSANMVFDGSTLTTLNSVYTGTLTGGTGVVNLGSGQFYKDSSGNVTIGATTAFSKLGVSTANGNLGITGGNTSGGNKIQSFGATTTSNGYLAFEGYSAEYMRIDSSGNVGIGTASPSGRLELSGSSATRWQTTDANWINEITTNPAKNAYVGRASDALAHVWKLSNSEALRLNTSANLVLQGGTTTANGVGVTFPASQSASSDANCLDDYEEGTFTPSDGSGAGLSLSFGGISNYTKIGRYVFANFSVTYPTTANTNGAAIQGLPFICATNANGVGAVSYTTYSLAMANYVAASTNYMYFSGYGAGITNANLSGKRIDISICYIV